MYNVRFQSRVTLWGNNEIVASIWGEKCQYLKLPKKLIAIQWEKNPGNISNYPSDLAGYLADPHYVGLRDIRTIERK